MCSSGTHVGVCVCTCRAHVCARVCEGQRLIIGIILAFPPYLLGGGVTQSNPELASTAGLANQLALRTPSPLSEAGIAGRCPCPISIYVGSEDSNSHFHACAAKDLTTEPFSSLSPSCKD